MTKLDRLNTFMTERLMAAVKEILFTVGRTVREYEEETERIRSENERLKQMLRDSGCIRERANPGMTLKNIMVNVFPLCLKELMTIGLSLSIYSGHITS